MTRLAAARGGESPPGRASREAKVPGGRGGLAVAIPFGQWDTGLSVISHKDSPASRQAANVGMTSGLHPSSSRLRGRNQPTGGGAKSVGTLLLMTCLWGEWRSPSLRTTGSPRAAAAPPASSAGTWWRTAEAAGGSGVSFGGLGHGVTPLEVLGLDLLLL